MAQLIHPTALCSGAKLAADAEVGAYSVIGQGSSVGAGAHISNHVSIGKDARIGERVHIGPGAQVGDGCIVDADARIGANAVIEDGVRVHMGAEVRPGTAIGAAVPPHAIVGSAEGVITGYVDTHSDDTPPAAVLKQQSKESRVRGVRVYEMRDIPDLRGALSVGEFDANMPFVPKRYFLVHDVANERIRGEHAHRVCHQFLICTHGVCSLIVDDGKSRQEFRLDRPNLGVHLPPMVWGIQYKFSRDAVLLVFASEHYDPKDYIRNYDEFLKEAAG
jgi:carbonic anhydrase/acetyltransferase-like protein (isoleucine patch superfamily)